jgi:hypothetical protein
VARPRRTGPAAEHQAFILGDPGTRATYKAAYGETSALYYNVNVKPSFDQILQEIVRWATRL